jgi:hypothetical protein
MACGGGTTQAGAAPEGSRPEARALSRRSKAWPRAGNLLGIKLRVTFLGFSLIR